LYLSTAAVVVATVFGCLAFVHREQWLVPIYAYRHVHTPDSQGTDSNAKEVEDWLLQRPVLALPVLVSRLEDRDAAVCRRATRTLLEILRRHPDPTRPEDAQLSLTLGSLLSRQYAGYSPAGKAEAVTLAFAVLEQHLARWSPNVSTSLATAGQVVLSSLREIDPLVLESTLRGLPAAWRWNGSDNVAQRLSVYWKWRCNRRVVEHLSSDSPMVRAAAARALNGAIVHSGDGKLQELLNDRDPAVCKAALMTIADSSVDSIGAPARSRLIELLDDSDAEIRTLAQKVLIASGLSEAHVRVVVLMRRADPMERAQAADALREAPDIDPVRVLTDLARDASAIVRLAAVRAAVKLSDPSLKELLEQLAQDDPNEEVRQACRSEAEKVSADAGRDVDVR
jgi:hypothetical protein